MRPELERLHLIEQHLLGPTAPADVVGWEARLLLDPTLRADADAQRRLYAGIRAAGRRQLRQELTGIHQRLFGGQRRGRPASLGTRLRALLRRFRWG